MAKTKPNKKVRTKNENTFSGTFIKVQIFAVICYTSVFIAGSFLALSIDLPDKYDYVYSLVLLTLCSFLTGFYAGLKLRENGLLVGILYALPMNVLTILISAVLCDFDIGLNTIISAVVLIVASGIGGIFAVNKRIRR